jgi:hypothetical protein
LADDRISGAAFRPHERDAFAAAFSPWFFRAIQIRSPTVERQKILTALGAFFFFAVKSRPFARPYFGFRFAPTRRKR